MGESFLHLTSDLSLFLPLTAELIISDSAGYFTTTGERMEVVILFFISDI